MSEGEGLEAHIRQKRHPVSDSMKSLAKDTRVHERGKIEELGSQAIHDSLTGLYNRRYFDQKLEELKGKDHALLLIDMDGLKQANDLTGSHAVGDRMLRLIADEMRSLVRDREGDKDIACRFGGDEFAIIFTNYVSPDILLGISRRLNNLINNHSYEIPVGGGIRRPVSLSVSIGGVVADKNMDMETLIKNADSALYDAKKTKNSTKIFGLEK